MQYCLGFSIISVLVFLQFYFFSFFVVVFKGCRRDFVTKSIWNQFIRVMSVRDSWVVKLCRIVWPSDEREIYIRSHNVNTNLKWNQHFAIGSLLILKYLNETQNHSSVFVEIPFCDVIIEIGFRAQQQRTEKLGHFTCLKLYTKCSIVSNIPFFFSDGII